MPSTLTEFVHVVPAGPGWKTVCGLPVDPGPDIAPRWKPLENVVPSDHWFGPFAGDKITCEECRGWMREEGYAH